MIVELAWWYDITVDDEGPLTYPPLTIMGGVSVGERVGEQVMANTRIFHLLSDGQWVANDMKLTTAAPMMCRCQGKVLAVSGSAGDIDMTATTLLYDVRRSKRTKLENTYIVRRHFGLLEYGDVVYAMGGVDKDKNILDNMETLDLGNNQWSRWMPTSPCPVPNAFPITAAGDGLVYVIENTCQFNKDHRRPVRHIRMDMFDTQRRRWLGVKYLPSRIASTSGSCGVFHNGSVYVVGGDARLCERYDCSDNKWETLPKPRYRHSFGHCTCYNNALLLCGGFDSDDSIEEYDISERKWKTWGVRMDKPLQYHFAVII